MSETEEQKTNAITSYNTHNIDSSTIKMRIDPSNMLDKVKIFLRGWEGVVTTDENGNTYFEKVEEGIPLANERGVQAIMRRLHMVFNTQVVQGNLNEDQYEYLVSYIHQSLADNIMDNRAEWGIGITDYEEIIDSIMVAVRCYLSRLLHDKERDSYAHTIKSLESNTLQNKKGFNLFNN